MNNSGDIVNDVSNMSSNNQNDNGEKSKNLIIVLLLIVITILIILLLYFTLGKKNNNVDTNVIVNEIRTVSNVKELYVNDKQVEEIKADSELGDIKIEEFKDILIVEEINPGPSRRLFIVDKNGNAIEFDYKVSTYNQELISTIDSYRVEGNNLYIKVNRQWGNGYIDWYCRYDDKNEIAEYEVKYEYSNGKFIRKEVLNEVSIKDKYKDEDCSNNISEKINYEIKKLTDSSNELEYYCLYVNGKKVDNIRANIPDIGDIKVEEFKDVLIVDETNPGPSRRLFIVDKNANAIELDYKVSTYNEELISTIDSYRVEGNNLYIKVKRQWGNGYIDWYCRYNDKDEIAEYEVKYEYSNGKFSEKQVVNEISIKDKYKDEDCSNVE